MDQSKILRKVSIFFLVFAAGMHIIIYAIYFFSGALIFDDLAYSELSWTQLLGTYPHLAYLISEYIRMMGMAVLVVEMFVLCAIYLVFLKNSKPGWVLATTGSAVPLLMELVLTYPIIGFSIPYMMYIMLTVMVMVGSIIGAMAVFGKKGA